MSAKAQIPIRDKRLPTAVGVFCLALLTIAFWILFPPAKPPADIPQVSTPRLSSAQAALVEHAHKEVIAKSRSGEAWGRYGMSLRAFDFNAEALRCFRVAELLDRNNPRWSYFISKILRAEKPAESLAYLQRTVDHVGNTPEAPRYYLAKILAEQGNVIEAEKHASALLSAHPDFIPVHLLLAQIAFSRGDTNAAAAHVKFCLNDSRSAKAAWALLASLQQRENNFAAAQESSRKSATAPADVPIADAYESEVTTLRGDPHDITDRVHTLLAARNTAEAGPIIDQLMREHPDFSETWLVRGRFLLIQKQLPAAEEALQKHLQFDPKSTQGLFQLGSVHLAANRFADAEKTFRRAIELKQDFGPAWFNLAYALGRQGKWADAAPAFEQAIRFNPEHIESYLLLADVQLQLGNLSEAQKLLAGAERINPQDPRLGPLRQKIARQQ